MTFSHAIAQFLSSCRTSKARTTAIAYESDLGQLQGHVRPNSVAAFTAAAVDAYLAASKDAGNTAATLKRKRAVCSSLGKFLVRRRLLAVNPVELVDSIKPPEKLPRPFSEEEVQALLRYSATLPAQERMLMGLLYYTGLRISPILGLKVGDIGKESLRAVGKGSKEQTVPMHPDLQAMLEVYIINHTTLDPKEPLLKNARGGPMTTQRAEKITREWGRVLMIPKCSPHRFRHTYGTGLLRDGANLRIVQQLMAHESLATTQMYLKVWQPEQQAAVLLMRHRMPVAQK